MCRVRLIVLIEQKFVVTPDTFLGPIFAEVEPRRDRSLAEFKWLG